MPLGRDSLAWARPVPLGRRTGRGAWVCFCDPVAWATECRLGEGASLEREISRLGENAQDFELTTGGFPLGRECLAWARMRRLGERTENGKRIRSGGPKGRESSPGAGLLSPGRARPRPGEPASPGRRKSRPGEKITVAMAKIVARATVSRPGEVQTLFFDLFLMDLSLKAMPRKESRKPRNESTDRKRLGRGPSRVFSDGRSGGLYSLTLRVDVRSGPTRSIPVWR
ncbi:unnamed protein product [Lupinus luteus]|uniref:Uncharacterized protein n=1 Tax=Lupinus luteus TaxID=3873 RepID=A0AAV1WP63_LUPLU